MTDDIGAVPAATSQGYGEAVTDEEFATWVKRSQADTDAAIADWDTSVQFDMVRSGPVAEVIEAEIIDGDDEADAAIAATRQRADIRWAELQTRILAGEELGPADRTWVALQQRIRQPDGYQPCEPGCETCAAMNRGDLATAFPEPPATFFRGPTRAVGFDISASGEILATLVEERREQDARIRDQMAEMLASARRFLVAKAKLEELGVVVLERTVMPGSAEDLGLILPSRDGDGLERRIRREFGVR